MAESNFKSLTSFLSILPAKPEEYVASKRIVDKDGKPLVWKIRPVSGKDDINLRKASMVSRPVPGRKGLKIDELDTNIYTLKLAAASTMYPDLKDKELQNACGVMNAEDLLGTILSSGELQEYLSKVQSVNGFSLTGDEEVEEAKN